LTTARHCVRNLVGTRTWSPEQILFGCEVEPIAGAGVGAHERTRCELDNGERARCSLNPPGPERLPRPADAAVAVDKNHVDRESHEERVDAVTRRQNQGRVVGEARTAEQTTIAGLPVERRFERPGHYVFVASVAQDPGCARRREDRVQEAQGSGERSALFGGSLPGNGSPAAVGRAPIGPEVRNWR